MSGFAFQLRAREWWISRDWPSRSGEPELANPFNTANFPSPSLRNFLTLFLRADFSDLCGNKSMPFVIEDLSEEQAQTRSKLFEIHNEIYSQIHPRSASNNSYISWNFLNINQSIKCL
jgi:hypothetical protein